jgi:hypothetical protein
MQSGKDQVVIAVDPHKASWTAATTGSFPGQKRPRTANSINPMLNLASQVLADLVRQGAIARDVAALVKRLKRPERAGRRPRCRKADHHT